MSAQKAAPKIDGAWKLTKMEYYGKVRPMDDWIQRHWTFRGEKVVVKVPGAGGRETPVEWDLKLDPSKIPAEITLTMNRVAGAASFRGIYEFKGDPIGGDKLTLCLTDDNDAPRPTEFKATRADRWTLLYLERDR
ncbi:MAG TPA: TIGR03067 domain-containing protein [Urbifossiella sp.]|nr:TIGR03067 domain-containing protein [Urbifossiella sp.]